MGEMPKAEYECFAKGHEGGSRIFEAAPPEWFAAKGQSTPRNCKPCRDWVKAQTDEMKTCTCGSKFPVTAKSKISHFKKVGPYEPINECHPCRDGNRPPKGTKKRLDREKRKEQEKKERQATFETLAHGIAIEPRPIAYDKSYYEEIIPNKKVRMPNVVWAEERWEHLMHHVPGSEYDWTHPSATQELNLVGRTSPTSFVGFNASFEELLESTKMQLQQASDKSVREYTPYDGRIIRVTFSGDHDGLELTFIDRLDDGSYGVATTYDNVKVSDVQGNTWYNR